MKLYIIYIHDFVYAVATYGHSTSVSIIYEFDIKDINYFSYSCNII
jgi:hypothetical protein